MALLQTAVNESTSNASSLVLTFGSNIAAGSLIYLTCMCFVANPTSVADGPGDTFTAIQSSPVNFNGSNYTGAWYALNSAGGSKTVTINLGTTGWYIAAVAQEWSGMATSSALDGSNISTFSSGSSVTTPSITTANANDVLISSWGVTTNTTLTAGSGWSNVTSENQTNTSSLTESRIVSSTGTYSGLGTITGSFSWIGTIAAFKTAGAVAGPVNFVKAATPMVTR